MVKKRLIHRWENSPLSYYDWALRMETRRLLEEVPPAELEAFYRELMAANIGKPMNDLSACVRKAWVMQDGPGAVLALPTQEPESFFSGFKV
ncbi:MAG: hypothetical protein QM755_10485 [Luteolibacter sp.]